VNLSENVSFEPFKNSDIDWNVDNHSAPTARCGRISVLRKYSTVQGADCQRRNPMGKGEDVQGYIEECEFE
jgi:hypothetical protein